MSLVQEISDLTARIRTEFNSVRAAIAALGGGGGGSDPWTRVGLASDFTNATVTFNDITGFTFTPAANANWTIEAEILLQTPLTTNLPRLGVIASGQSYYAVDIEYQTTATAKGYTEGWQTTGSTTQAAAGTAPVQGQPFLAKVLIKGRSGASPGAVKLQLACETAAANGAIAKRGSEFRYRSGPA